MTAEEIKEAKENLVEELNELPAEQQQEIIAEMYHFHRGPIPSPDELAKYKAVDPAIVDYVLSEAKANGAHVRACEQKEVDWRVAYNLRGQRYAFAAALGSLAICSLAIIFLDGIAGNVIALIFGATGVTPIITKFIENMKTLSKNDEDK